MAPTISKVLESGEFYPPQLRAAAKNLYEIKLQYTAKAAEQARLLVQDAEVLTVDDTELVAAFTKIVAIRAAAVKSCDDTFGIIAADFPDAPPPPPAPTPPPPPPPAEPAPAPAGDTPAAPVA